MSQTSAPTRAINFPVILLWVASIAVAAIGYLLVTTGLDAQVAFYGPDSSQDPRDALTAQSNSAIGATLIGVGVLGVLLAIAVHAHNFALAQAQAALTINDFDEFGDFDDDVEIVHSTVTPTEAVVVEEEIVVIADAALEAPAADAAEAKPAKAKAPKAAPAADETPAS